MQCFGGLLVLLAWVFFLLFYTIAAFLDDTCLQLQTFAHCKGAAQSLSAAQEEACNALPITQYLSCPDPVSFEDSYTLQLSEVSSPCGCSPTALREHV